MLPYRTCPVSRYEKLHRLGEGTYGTVYRARDRQTGEIVALKKLHMNREKGGFPLTSIREIKLLHSIDHPNLVKLHRIAVGPNADSIFLVFEYCVKDYATLIDRRSKPFSPGEIKTILLQLFSAVDYLHSNFILHRDLKLSNLLVTADNRLKLADFGLAREFSIPGGVYTGRVVTLWYRAPELLLGATKYHSGVDLWAVGAIFGELWKNEPILPGKTEIEQMELICALLGTPNERIWPEFQLIQPAGLELPNYPYNQLSSAFPGLSDAGLNLLGRLLTYDPSKRISAAKALHHPWFSEEPLPVPVEKIQQNLDEQEDRENEKTQRRKETKSTGGGIYRSGTENSSSSDGGSEFDGPTAVEESEARPQVGGKQPARISTDSSDSQPKKRMKVTEDSRSRGSTGSSEFDPEESEPEEQ